MVIEHPPALDVLEGAGARIDRGASRVYFPPELVAQTVAQIPRRYTYHGRTPEFDFTVTADGDIGARNTGGCTDWIDPITGERRRAGIKDWRHSCRIVDALPNVRSLANMHCGDVPGRVGDIHSLPTVLEAQRKCSVHRAATLESWRYHIEMLLAVRGSREALAERPLIHHMPAHGATHTWLR